MFYKIFKNNVEDNKWIVVYIYIVIIILFLSVFVCLIFFFIFKSCKMKYLDINLDECMYI